MGPDGRLNGVIRERQGMVGRLVPDATEDELREWEELVYDSCTMCGRTLSSNRRSGVRPQRREQKEGWS